MKGTTKVTAGMRYHEGKETKHTKVGNVKVATHHAFPKKKVSGVKDATTMFKTK